MIEVTKYSKIQIGHVGIFQESLPRILSCLFQKHLEKFSALAVVLCPFPDNAQFLT
jgi:hypothetical protein